MYIKICTILWQYRYLPQKIMASGLMRPEDQWWLLSYFNHKNWHPWWWQCWGQWWQKGDITTNTSSKGTQPKTKTISNIWVGTSYGRACLSDHIQDNIYQMFCSINIHKGNLPQQQYHHEFTKTNPQVVNCWTETHFQFTWSPWSSCWTETWNMGGAACISSLVRLEIGWRKDLVRHDVKHERPVGKLVEICCRGWSTIKGLIHKP